MADTKITALTALTAADPINDVIPIVDVSDTSMAASGTTKKISVNNILSSSPTASGALTVTGLVTAGSATITGALTVDTTTLVVNATTDRVGIATATPGCRVDIVSDSNTSLAPVLRVNSNNVAVNTALAYDGLIGSSTLTIQSGTSAPMIFNTNNVNERYRIDSTGIATWTVAGSTAMTLNSTGLNVVGSMAIGGASLTYPLNVRANSSNIGNTSFLFEQLNGTPIVTMRDNGTVIVAGDIRVGNTVSVVSPTAPNRTITMVVNGVTLYIAAKTTND